MIRVLIADDSAAIRGCFSSLPSQQDGFEVVGLAWDGANNGGGSQVAEARLSAALDVARLAGSDFLPAAVDPAA